MGSEAKAAWVALAAPLPSPALRSCSHSTGSGDVSTSMMVSEAVLHHAGVLQKDTGLVTGDQCRCELVQTAYLDGLRHAGLCPRPLLQPDLQSTIFKHSGAPQLLPDDEGCC